MFSEIKNVKCPMCKSDISYFKIKEYNGDKNSQVKNIYVCPECEYKIADSEEEAKRIVEEIE